MHPLTPSQIVDLHGDITERLKYDKMFRGANGAIIWSELLVTYEQRPIPYEQKDAEARAARDLLLDTMARHAQSAYLYRATADMVDLMLFAADGLEQEDAWDPALAPTQTGLIRFDKPIRMAWVPDSDEALQADWMMWGPGPKERTLISFWADTARPDEAWRNMLVAQGNASERVARAHGRWSLVGYDLFRPGKSMGPAILPLPGRALTDAEVDDLVEGIEGQRGTQAGLIFEAEGGLEEMQQSNDMRICHALWLLLGQTITVLREEAPDRHARKRAIRKGLPPRVTTIELRRHEHTRPVDGQAHVEWHHRWIVRGHWRWQACGPNRSERKRIWVSPYVKGPDDKPLKQSEKLYDLRR